MRKNFIFTNKKHSVLSIASFSFGMICLVSLVIAVYLTGVAKGVATAGYGVTGLFVLLISFVSLVIGINEIRKPGNFKIFPILGILINLFNLICIAFILKLGA